MKDQQPMDRPQPGQYQPFPPQGGQQQKMNQPGQMGMHNSHRDQQHGRRGHGQQQIQF